MFKYSITAPYLLCEVMHLFLFAGHTFPVKSINCSHHVTLLNIEITPALLHVWPAFYREKQIMSTCVNLEVGLNTLHRKKN